MIQSETPKIVKKKLFSPIWLLPVIALILGGWLLVKGIKDAGVEITIHFPNATGIEIGKTLVKYQGVNVGKVTDIEIDNSLQGVIVTVNMNYRGEPFLNDNTQFWLVSPKASITKIEGLDTLFSGNYIAIKPGDGAARLKFKASLEAPPIMPASEGMLLTLYSDKLGSLDIGSHVFYRQIPVGNVVSFRLDHSDQVALSVFIQKQYAYLVKQDSHFWNTSGVKFDASLSGIKVEAESLASIIAGGISVDSPREGKKAQSGSTFTLFDSKAEATGGSKIHLLVDSADDISKGTSIEYRGLIIGKVTNLELRKNHIEAEAEIYKKYTSLLGNTSKFWTEGAQIELNGIKHVSRLLTGSVINFLPGRGPINDSFPLQKKVPDEVKMPSHKFTINSQRNYGLTAGSKIKFRNIDIGKITNISLSKNLDQVHFKAEVKPEFSRLIDSNNYLVPISTLNVKASLDGITVKTGDLAGALAGSIELVSDSTESMHSSTNYMPLYSTKDEASDAKIAKNSSRYQLTSTNAFGLIKGSSIFYKKMKIGEVESVLWQSKIDSFSIDLAINNEYKSLLNKRSIFWRNQAATVDASLSGIKVNIAPLDGLLKSSINLGLLEKPLTANSKILYESKEYATTQATPITIEFAVSSNLKSGAAIRYQGFDVGKIVNVRLDSTLKTLIATGYLNSKYSEPFTKSDSEYFIVDAQVSLSGIKAPETLLTGAYVSVSPGNNGVFANSFAGKLNKTPFANVPQNSLRISLTKKELGSITIGTHIFYRGIPIGQVETFRLSQHGNQVEIEAYIDAKFSKFVNQSSQFWERSGIKVDAGIFSGLQIDTGSLENILVGGIAVVTKDKTSDSNRLTIQNNFKLHSEVKQEWHDWAPKQ